MFGRIALNKIRQLIALSNGIDAVIEGCGNRWEQGIHPLSVGVSRGEEGEVADNIGDIHMGAPRWSRNSSIFIKLI